MITNEEFLIRYNNAKTEALEWRDTFEKAYKYILPEKNIFDTEGAVQPGRLKGSDALDATMQSNVMTHASKIMSIVPRDQNWADIISGFSIPNSVKPIFNQQFQAIRDIFFSYLRNSNFGQAMHEMALELSISTGAMVCLPGNEEKPFNFQSVSISEVFLEEGAFGDIQTVYREYRAVPVRAIPDMWPQAKESKAFASFYNDNIDEKIALKEGTIYIAPNKYQYIVYADVLGTDIVNVTEDSSPWIIAREMKRPGELYGSAPGLQSLPTVLTLNKIWEYKLIGAEWQVAPVFTSLSDGLYNPHVQKVLPGAVIPIQPVTTGRSPLEHIPISANVQFTELLIQELQQQIKELFMVDPIGNMQDSTKTAYEINLRQQLHIEKWQPVFDRLQVELLPKIVNRGLYILEKFNKLPKIQINGSVVDLEYASALGQSVSANKVTRFQQFFQILSEIAGPQMALMGLHTEQIPEFIAQNLGVDLKLVKNTQEMNEVAMKAAPLIQQHVNDAIQNQKAA